MSSREKDRISNLPNEVMDHILSYLPIKDSGRTSLLSRNWRYKWTTVPCLVFNDETLPLLPDQQGSMIRKLIGDIDRILLLHSGPICKFDLSYDVDELPSDDMDRWILHISRHPVQELTLEMPCSQNYKMPPSFFSFESLTDLVLKNCLLGPPPSTFNGFKSLKSLELVQVSSCQDVLEILISSCMQLRDLSLYKVFGVDHLNINARNLQYFNFGEPCCSSDDKAYQINVNALNLQYVFFGGPCDYLSLKSTSCLREVFLCTPTFHPSHNGTLLKLLVDIPQIERLIIGCFAFEALDLIPRALPAPYHHLKCLHAILNFSSLKESLGLLCLLRSVPNLRKLTIGSFIYKTGQSISSNIWQADQWNSPFNRLQVVQINDLGWTEYEIDFIKFILLISPLLVEMIVKPSRDFISSQRLSNGPDVDVKDWKIVKQIQSLKRASPNAPIIIDLYRDI